MSSSRDRVPFEMSQAEADEQFDQVFGEPTIVRTESKWSSEDEYIDLFRPKREIVTRDHNLIYVDNGYLRNAS